MAVADASALVRGGGGLRVLEDRPRLHAAVLASLAQWAHRFSPVVSIDPPDGLLLDVGGCDRVFGGEERLVRRLVRGARRLGFTARTGLSSTFAASWALARGGGATHPIVRGGMEREAIAPLEVGLLRLDAEVVAKLASIGVERIGDLMALPRSAIPVRFGGEVLLRIDQALGCAIEPITEVRPRAPVEVARVFDGPTTQMEAIEGTVRELLVEIESLLLAKESGAREMVCVLVRADLEPVRLELVLSRPARDHGHLWSLIRPRLERLHLGYGVEEITLTATWVAPITHRQGECFEEVAISNQEAARRSAELIDTLTNRLGVDRVLRPALAQSHIPERAFVLAAACSRPSGRAAVDGASLPARPSLVFAMPSVAQVMSITPDGPVIGLRWRGEELGVLRCIGPERIGPEWWEAHRGTATHTGRTRDYFIVEDDGGRWLWLYREIESGWWFVQGIWS